MPVEKVTPSAWSGHTGVAIRQLTSRRLLAVTELSSTVYFWVSTDCGETWTAHSGLASDTKRSTFSVSPVTPDNKVLIVNFTRSSTPGHPPNYRIFGEDADGETVSAVTTWGSSNAAGYYLRLFRTPPDPDNDRARVVQTTGSNHGTFAVGSDLRDGTVWLFSLPTVWIDRHIDWGHTGDGRTASSTLIWFAPHQSFSTQLATTSGLYAITGGWDEIAACDGSNIWLYDDQGNTGQAHLIRVPYSRLSQAATDYPQTGKPLAHCHYQGKLLALVANGTNGRVYTLDVATSSWHSESGSETYESHADFAATSRTWDVERYPVEEVMHLIRTDGSNAAYYRVVENTAPGRPTLTLPAVRTTDADLDLDWTFSDPEGHTQQSYELRRRVGTGDWEYWNGTSWVDSASASTIIAHTTQEETLTSSEWRKSGSTDDHWFGLRVRDDPPGDESEWSSDVRVRVLAVPNPDITLIDNVDASGGSVTVIRLAAVVEWTTGTQEEYRVQTFADNSGSVGTERSDSGWLTAGSERSHAVTFGADAEEGHVRVSVRGYGSAVVTDTVSYTVDLPDPPGDSTTTVAVNGTYEDHLRISGSWSPPGTAEVETADLYRRVVGTSGDGILRAEGLEAASDAITFDDWLVRHGVDYEYRWEATTDEGGVTLDSAWTS